MSSKYKVYFSNNNMLLIKSTEVSKTYNRINIVHLCVCVCVSLTCKTKNSWLKLIVVKNISLHFEDYKNRSNCQVSKGEKINNINPNNILLKFDRHHECEYSISQMNGLIN